MSNSEAVNDFVSSLNDLKTTNKANISMLTILADDDKNLAPEITKVIENRLREAPPNEKLPVLYLIDSIVKNLPETQYRDRFSENIVNNFVSVFSQVDEKVRAAMYKVRQTWNEIFAAKKLFVLDVKVNKVDPKWPIIPLPPENMAQRPMTTKSSMSVPESTLQAAQPVMPASAPFVNSASITNESIAAKEEELRRLREKHLEMQLQKQRVVNQQQEEELARLEQAKDVEKRLASIVDQLKSSTIPESAQKILLETVKMTISTAQASSSSSPSSSTGSNIATAVLPRDPRKRNIQEQTAAKSDEVFSQVVQNLQEAARCLKPSETADEEPSAKTSKLNDVASTETAVQCPGSKRFFELKEDLSSALKKPKVESYEHTEEASVEGTMDVVEKTLENIKAEEEETGSDAEFHAAVEDYRHIASERPAGLYPSEAQQPRSILKASQPQPLEPVQPLKPPGSATALPSGPGPMPVPSEGNRASTSSSSGKAPMTEKDQNRLLDEAERQLQSGQLTAAQHGDLVNHLEQLYDIHKKIVSARAPQEGEPATAAAPVSSGSGGHPTTSSATVTTTAPSTAPAITTTSPGEAGKSVPSAASALKPPKVELQPSRPPQPPLLPTPASTSGESSDKLLQPASFPSTAHVVLNGEPIDMTIGGPPRTIFVAGRRRVVRINAQSRQIQMDGRPVYKLSSPLREIMVDGCRCMIFYHGEMQSIWINSVEYRIRVDAPPQTVTVDGNPIELVVDSGAGDIIVNGERACPIANLPCDVALPPNGNRYRFSFHAPARQIQIDNQICEVKLDLPLPAVLINGELRGIRFDGPPRILLVDDEPFEIHTDKAIPLKLGCDTTPLKVQLGAPAQELIIGEHRYNIGFGTGPVYLMVNEKKVKVELPGSTPGVILLGLIDPATGQLSESPTLPPMPMPPMPPPIPPMPPFGTVPFGPPSMPPIPPIPPPGAPPFDFRFFPPSQMATDQAQHSGSYAEPSPHVEQIALPAPPQPPMPVIPPPMPPAPAPPATGAPGSVDINDLISRLMTQGMLPPPGTATPAKGPENDKAKVQETPDLSDFNMDLFKTKYSTEITRLYAGVQCGMCGCRFPGPESNRYRLHLDWHFRVNKREREAVRVLRHRAWFLPVLDWISLEESAEPDQSLGVNESSMMVNINEEGGASGTSGKIAEVPTSKASAAVSGSGAGEKRPDQLALLDQQLPGSGESGDGHSNGTAVVSCPAASDTKKDSCVVCGEGFETFWNEELDEWHLKDAVCVANKTYHTVCFEDAARIVASTPSSPTFPVQSPLIAKTNENKTLDQSNKNNNKINSAASDTSNSNSNNNNSNDDDDGSKNNSNDIKAEDCCKSNDIVPKMSSPLPLPPGAIACEFADHVKHEPSVTEETNAGETSAS